MRFTTIWTLRSMTLKERLLRTRDCFAMYVGRKLPLRVRFWCSMQMIGKAVATSPEIPATSLEHILKELPRPKTVC